MEGDTSLYFLNIYLFIYFLSFELIVVQEGWEAHFRVSVVGYNCNLLVISNIAFSLISDMPVLFNSQFLIPISTDINRYRYMQ